ncbi:hypothetical protein OF83DRAFT_1086000 [Amylostereum chailletii]|nr:hypothetical protein OF83DRAFT_1086000 [Amylostereum chailletii]
MVSHLDHSLDLRREPSYPSGVVVHSMNEFVELDNVHPIDVPGAAWVVFRSSPPRHEGVHDDWSRVFKILNDTDEVVWHEFANEADARQACRDNPEGVAEVKTAPGTCRCGKEGCSDAGDDHRGNLHEDATCVALSGDATVPSIDDDVHSENFDLRSAPSLSLTSIRSDATSVFGRPYALKSSVGDAPKGSDTLNLRRVLDEPSVPLARKRARHDLETTHSISSSAGAVPSHQASLSLKASEENWGALLNPVAVTRQPITTGRSFWAVGCGRDIGVFLNSWTVIRNIVDLPGSRYRRCRTREEACHWYLEHRKHHKVEVEADAVMSESAQEVLAVQNNLGIVTDKDHESEDELSFAPLVVVRSNGRYSILRDVEAQTRPREPDNEKAGSLVEPGTNDPGLIEVDQVVTLVKAPASVNDEIVGRNKIKLNEPRAGWLTRTHTKADPLLSDEVEHRDSAHDDLRTPPRISRGHDGSSFQAVVTAVVWTGTEVYGVLWEQGRVGPALRGGSTESCVVKILRNLLTVHRVVDSNQSLRQAGINTSRLGDRRDWFESNRVAMRRDSRGDALQGEEPLYALLVVVMLLAPDNNLHAH